MKNVLTTIWNFINSKIFGYVMIGLLILVLMGTCSRNNKLKEEAVRTEQNVAALNGKIVNEKIKLGKLQASNDGYIADVKELKQYNAELAKEVKDQKGKVITYSRIIFTLEQDKAELERWKREHENTPEPPTPESDSTWRVPWNATYVYDSINFDAYSGITRVGLRGPFDLSKISVFHNGTVLTYRNSQIGLSWGQKWEGTGKNKQLKVFANTEHPAFKAQLLQGTYVDYPKKQHWLAGFGVGPQIGVGYDFIHNQPALTVGLSFHYNIYQW